MNHGAETSERVTVDKLPGIASRNGVGPLRLENLSHCGHPNSATLLAKDVGRVAHTQAYHVTESFRPSK